MFNLLPFTFIYSVFLWAAVIYIFVACAQLIMFEKIAKRENPNVKNYSTMTEDQKTGAKKIGWKIGRGLIALIVMALVDHFFVSGK